jgi:hypothetical protein
MAMPERDLAVGVIDNYQEPNMDPLAEDILTIALGDEPQARPAPVDPTKLPIAEPDRSDWDRRVGQYVGERDSVRISRVGDRLVGTLTSGDAFSIAQMLGSNEGRSFDLVPVGPTDFVVVGDVTTLDGMPASFKVEADGNVALMFGGFRLGTRQDG